MAFRCEEVTRHKTIVICDKCGVERKLGETTQPLSFDNRMNMALRNGYTFKQEGSVFKNYCFRCQSQMREEEQS